MHKISLLYASFEIRIKLLVTYETEKQFIASDSRLAGGKASATLYQAKIILLQLRKQKKSLLRTANCAAWSCKTSLQQDLHVHDILTSKDVTWTDVGRRLTKQGVREKNARYLYCTQAEWNPNQDVDNTWNWKLVIAIPGWRQSFRYSIQTIILQLRKPTMMNKSLQRTAYCAVIV